MKVFSLGAVLCCAAQARALVAVPLGAPRLERSLRAPSATMTMRRSAVIGAAVAIASSLEPAHGAPAPV